jgi:predicted hotdog family 3-hydroxylacyl-ACP dehydratase
MLLVDELCEYDAKSAVVKAVVRDGLCSVRDGKMDAHWAVEIIAQAIAVLFGYEWVRAGRKVSFGYVIAVDDFTINTDEELVVGDSMRCSVRLDYEAFPMGVYLGEIHTPNGLWVKAKLKCFLNENFEGMKP